MSVTTPDLNISFEGHLADTLAQLRDVLPNELASQLAVYLTEPRPKTIPYSFIHAVSQWVRTPAGSSNVSSPNDYSMVALLAGTTTSPERKFGTYVPPPDPDAVAAHASQERKQITTLINGVLSVGGSAMAALWASEHTGWKYEWVCVLSIPSVQGTESTIACPLFLLCCHCRRYLGGGSVHYLAVSTRRFKET